jgi:hypothetical protein
LSRQTPKKQKGTPLIKSHHQTLSKSLHVKLSENDPMLQNLKTNYKLKRKSKFQANLPNIQGNTGTFCG